MPEVSIIVPTYQHQRYISQCLESIVKQSFFDWEAIVVDDGSTDKTPAIVKSFAANDSRIRYFHQANKGIYRLSELYNFALSKSSGELIAVLEGDDYWPKRKLKLQTPAFSNKKIGLVWGNGMTDQDGQLAPLDGYVGKLEPSALSNRPIGSALPEIVFSGKYLRMPTCSVMMRRKAIEEIGGFYQPAGLPWLDRSTWAALACVTEFRHLPENLGVWRRHSAQVTQNNKDARTTWDLTFQDPNCPAALKEALANYEAQYRIWSAYIRCYRRRTGQNALKCAAISIRHPVLFAKFLSRLSKQRSRTSDRQ